MAVSHLSVWEKHVSIRKKGLAYAGSITDVITNLCYVCGLDEREAAVGGHIISYDMAADSRFVFI